MVCYFSKVVLWVASGGGEEGGRGTPEQSLAPCVQGALAEARTEVVIVRGSHKHRAGQTVQWSTPRHQPHGGGQQSWAIIPSTKIFY